MNIVPGDLENEQVHALLAEHLRTLSDVSPPFTMYALDLSGLQKPDISFFAAWDGDELLGFGALRELTPTSGEIKSMRTASAHLRKGVAAAILDHLLALARSRGYVRVSLETGAGDAFEPALALYRRYGFVQGEVFGDYAESDFNQFFHLAL